MSQAIHLDGELRAFLDDHRESFETLTGHDDEEVAELFGEIPLQLLEEGEGDE